MKTNKELNAIKRKVEAVSGKIHELNDEELKIVIGGFKVVPDDQSSWWRMLLDLFFKKGDNNKSKAADRHR